MGEGPVGVVPRAVAFAIAIATPLAAMAQATAAPLRESDIARRQVYDVLP
jgi:hypothetical protein